MTAIGLLLLLLGFGAVFIETSDVWTPPERIRELAPYAILAGALLCAAGVLVKLWQVMP
jgi:hypothetical protein